MKRRQISEDYRYERESSVDLPIEIWFRQAGLRQSQAEAARRTCEEQLVYTVSDLRLVHSRGQLRCLLPQAGISSRIEAQLGASICDSGSDSMEEETPIHIKCGRLTVPCDVTPSTTMREIKEFIRGTSLGCPVEAQQLIFCGRQLLDDKTVASYCIEPYSCIYLIPRKAPAW